jgi:hypothetical protein
MSFKLTLPSGSEMRMTRLASGIPEHFLIPVRGAIHAIKDMGLNTKFKEAMDAVETMTLDLNTAKAAYKHELKKGEGDDIPQQAVGAGKSAPDKAKKLKKAEDEESPQAAIVTGKAVLDRAKKARNEAQE